MQELAMPNSKELHPNQLTWEEMHPDTYYVEKIFISKYLNNKPATKTSNKAGSQKATK